MVNSAAHRARGQGGECSGSRGRLLRVVDSKTILGEGYGAGRLAVDDHTLAGAKALVERVRDGGLDAALAIGRELGDLKPGEESLFLGREELEAAAASLPEENRALLERTGERIRTFARAQLDWLLGGDQVGWGAGSGGGGERWVPLESRRTIRVPGGTAGQSMAPVGSVGCYVPGGRFPLPSTALMTAVTARVAGVPRVWVASPRPGPVLLAAAAIGGADGIIALGGAQVVALMAFGCQGLEPFDMIVGPGNRWVTAAKQLVCGQVGIDMLAGPSELVVVADSSADPALVAADLLAQGEHDPDALPILISLDPSLPGRVEEQLVLQMDGMGAKLDRGATEAALENGFAVVVDTLEEAAALSNRIGPEHLQLVLDGQVLAGEDGCGLHLFDSYGALFTGALACEVLGDYGAGPNHVLPTGGTARFTGGLSVGTFLRTRTWLQIDDALEGAEVARDAAALARIEGLHCHAGAVDRRFQLK